MSRPSRLSRPVRLLALAFSFPALRSAQSTPCQGGQAFDDGTGELYPTFGHYTGSGAHHFVSRFTPPNYPYHYDRVCLNLVAHVDHPQDSFEVIVYDDDGDPRINGQGSPGTQLAAIPVQVDVPLAPQWFSVDLGCVVVTGGSVWIGVRWTPGNGLDLGIDTDRVHAYRYPTDAVFWNPSYSGETGALMVRALGAPGDGLALAQPRNGSGVNPALYAADAPRIGGAWSASVDHSSLPGTTATQVRIYAGGTPGFLLPQGELLVDLGTARYFVSTRVSSAPIDVHGAAIPSDPALIGLSAASQALVLLPGRIVLCNAVDLRIGC